MNSTILFLIVTVFSVISLINGQAFVVPPNPENPGVCIYNGQQLKVGENQLPGACLKLHCSEDGSIHATGCGKIGLHGCKEGNLVDVNKPFPECCKRHFDCVKDDGTSYVTEFYPN